MKNTKKIICLALTLCMTMGLAACSGGREEVMQVSGLMDVKDNDTVRIDDKTTDGSKSDTAKSDDTAPVTNDADSIKSETSGGEKKEAATADTDEYIAEDLPAIDADGYAAMEGAADDYAASPRTRSLTADSAGLTTDVPDEALVGPTVSSADDGDTYIDTDPPEDEPSTDIIIDDPDPQPEPAVGLLTAGEWNDNDNWGFFTNLVNNNKITFPSFGIDPRYRTKVIVKSTSGDPVVNASVKLYGPGEDPIWEAVTDKKGVAYVFESGPAEGLYVIAESDGKSEKMLLSNVDAADGQGNNNTSDGDLTVTLDAAGQLYKNTDIMFIVDATGSMSDEMLFLQTEFTAIAEEIGSENVRYAVNFYRDEGDEYVTKCNDFTSDISELQRALNSESAKGGGDTPEAVDEILEESLVKASWNSDSVKIAFMIFDAPPHAGKEASIINSIKTAAAKGIRLIPVISSGTERDTELFGRAIAITTGGTYVFLTDDSGVGGSHLEPIIGKYEVEKLYDVILRLVEQYRQ